jgi:hypothetical protein
VRPSKRTRDGWGFSDDTVAIWWIITEDAFTIQLKYQEKAASGKKMLRSGVPSQQKCW